MLWVKLKKYVRYWRELLDRIRDIRSSEKLIYRQVLDLYFPPCAEQKSQDTQGEKGRMCRARGVGYASQYRA